MFWLKASAAPAGTCRRREPLCLLGRRFQNRSRASAAWSFPNCWSRKRTSPYRRVSALVNMAKISCASLWSKTSSVSVRPRATSVVSSKMRRINSTTSFRSRRGANPRTQRFMAAPLKVGVAGLGTVGAALVAQISRQRDALAVRCGRSIDIVAVSARSRTKDRGIDVKKMKWVKDPVELAREPDLDVFVELIGGDGEPARGAIEAALASGKSVVTANKALLARHGVKLAALAERSHVALNFEAAVGGAIPIVKTLREGMAGNSFERIYGILNGTCNYILTRMEEDRLPFADCLKDAQRLGYAEADPSFDIEGHDTAQKLAVLASLAFGTKVDQSAIYVEGISSITPADLSAADE